MLAALLNSKMYRTYATAGFGRLKPPSFSKLDYAVFLLGQVNLHADQSGRASAKLESRYHQPFICATSNCCRHACSGRTRAVMWSLMAAASFFDDTVLFSRSLASSR